MAESIVQLSNIDDNIQVKKITQQRKMRDILPQNGNTDESKKEANNVSAKIIKETKLPLDIDEYENSLISSSKFILT